MASVTVLIKWSLMLWQTKTRNKPYNLGAIRFCKVYFRAYFGFDMSAKIKFL
jgi:hypothetical protein